MGDGDPLKLEDWYYSLWAYNGFAKSNNPNLYDGVYQQGIFHTIQNPPMNLWTWPATFANIAVPALSDIGSGAKPTGALPYTPASYHIATDYAGTVVEVQPSYTVSATRSSGAPSGEIDVLVTVTNQTSYAGKAVAIGHVHSPIAIMLMEGGAKLNPINDPSDQLLPANGTITFTLKYSTTGTPLEVEYQFVCTDYTALIDTRRIH
jgi:hypothetical protein